MLLLSVYVDSVINFKDTRYIELGNFLRPMINETTKITMLESGGAPVVAYYLNKTVINIERNDTYPDFIIFENPIIFYSSNDRDSIDVKEGFVISRKPLNMSLIKTFSVGTVGFLFNPPVIYLYKA